MDEFYNLIQLEEKFSQSFPNSPLLVHCSAGLGRTGVFLLVYFSLRQFDKSHENNSEFNMFEAIKQLRDQRAGMIQKSVEFEWS